MRILLAGFANSIHIQRLWEYLEYAGHTIAVASWQDGPHCDYKLNPKPPLPGKLSYFAMLSDLQKAIHKFHPDLLHAHNATSYGVLAARSGFHPLLISTWGLDITDVARRNRVAAFLVRWGLQKADGIAATSEFLRKETQFLCPKKPISVTPFGIDTRYFKPRNLREKDELVIGTARHLLPGYGLDILLEAYSLLRGKHGVDFTRLLIVGGGVLETCLKKQCDRLGLSRYVQWVGKIPPPEILQYYQQMDLFVIPSVHQEAFGVAVLEAAACGIPVIGSNLGGLPEVIQDGITGLLVPPNDPQALAEAMEMLLQDGARRKSMAEAGRTMAEHFDIRETTKTFENLYRSLISSK